MTISITLIIIVVLSSIQVFDISGLPLNVPNVYDSVKINHDISFPTKDVAKIENDFKVKRITKRGVVEDKTVLWTNGQVPYYIDETFFEDHELIKIKEAFKEFHLKTCIRFIPRTDQTPYLFISPFSRCWSEIGMPKDAEAIRSLSLGPECLEKKGTILHELMHILGFWHEQNRPDRDNYITIMWDNIYEDDQHNFYKYSADKVDTQNEPYDYQSIMHYSAHAYAKDPELPTIVPHIDVEIGQRIQLSTLDVKKVKKLYGCSSYPFNKMRWPWQRVTTTTPFPIEKKVKQPASTFKTQSNANKNPGGIIYPSQSEHIAIPVFLDWISGTTTDASRIVFPS